MTLDVGFQTWNIFHRRGDEGLCCAVAADAPLPRFLLSGEWSFGFAHAGGDPPSKGFSPAAAEVAISASGFYLFLSFAAPSTESH